MTNEEIQKMREFVATKPTSLLIEMLSTDRDAIRQEMVGLTGSWGVGAAAVLRLVVHQEIDRRIPVPT